MEKELILDGHKLAWHPERVRAWLNGERIAPITIDWALTQHCSYNCVYCYNQLQRNETPPLTKEEIFSFIDDAKDIGVKAISFVSDGESTCSPYFYDAIKRTHSNGLDVAVGTNGYLLDDSKLSEILPLLTYLRFNISAGTAERYAEIHGCSALCFDKVRKTILQAVKLKKENNLKVTIGLQMVLMPEFADQIMPLAELGKELEVDYLVIKHCSDDEDGSLGVEYEKYKPLFNIIEQAENLSTDSYSVQAKWSKLLTGRQRSYKQCYGSAFLLQLSGSGLVAACGSFFNPKYSKFHIGNLKEQSFRQIWESERYWEVMNFLASEAFNACNDCGTLCLQHKINEYLWDVKNGEQSVQECELKQKPPHVNFI